MRKVLKLALLLLLLGVAKIVYFSSHFVMICNTFVLFRQESIQRVVNTFQCGLLISLVLTCPILLFSVLLIYFCSFLVNFGRFGRTR